jgi:hypothetical protein
LVVVIASGLAEFGKSARRWITIKVQGMSRFSAGRIEAMYSGDLNTGSSISLNEASKENSIILSACARGVEVFLALVLMIAAALKAYQLFNHSNPLITGWMLSKIILASLIEAEILLSIWLFVGGFRQIRFIIALVCFCMFAVAAGYEAFRAIPSCGCFGNVKVPPAITAAFDVTAVIALWFTRPRIPRLRNVFPSRRRALCGAIVAASATAMLWTGYFLNRALAESPSAGSRGGDLVIIEPQVWLNQSFPLFDSIENGSQLRNGRWLLVLYHYDCDSCLEAIPNYASLASTAGSNSTGPRLAFIALPPTAPEGQEPVTPSSSYQRLILRPDHDWFATTPIVIALQDGRVLVAEEGEKAVHPPRIPEWDR